MTNLQQIANEIRKELVILHNRTHTSHIGSEFSALEILLVLFYEIMNVTPHNFTSVDRDHFILSKGHSAPALYAVLYRQGFIQKEIFDSYGNNGSLLFEHPKNDVPGIDASTGSLGHGLSIAVGMALALKKSNSTGKVYTLLSDGECQEGSTVEALNFAGRMRLDNLIAIIDNNDLQGYSRTSEIQSIESVKSKFESAGWATKNVNGHNFEEIKSALSYVPFEDERPSLLIANTIKGRGLREMENRLEWHYKSPSTEEVKIFLEELGGAK